MDRAALDVARELGMPCGGWCPRGRLAEDGPIDPRYPLRETPSDDYAERTEWNVRDADATLILTIGQPAGGTAFTVDCAKRLKKPFRILDLSRTPRIATVRAWLSRHRVNILNVAGPRESKCVGIYAQAARCLRLLFSHSSNA